MQDMRYVAFVSLRSYLLQREEEKTYLLVKEKYIRILPYLTYQLKRGANNNYHSNTDYKIKWYNLDGKLGQLKMRALCELGLLKEQAKPEINTDFL